MEYILLITLIIFIQIPMVGQDMDGFGVTDMTLSKDQTLLMENGKAMCRWVNSTRFFQTRDPPLSINDLQFFIHQFLPRR